MKRFLFSLTVLLLTARCGSSTSPSGSDGGPDGGPATTFVLTIDNYLDWCAITEDGQPYNSSETFDAGTVVDLHAQPLNGFVWGYWTGTDAAMGGQDTNMTATVTMTSNKAVLACCPNPPPATQDCSTGTGGGGGGY